MNTEPERGGPCLYVALAGATWVVVGILLAVFLAWVARGV